MAQKGRKGPKSPFSGYTPQKGHFWPFCRKMAIFGHFAEKEPGSYRAKNPEISKKGPKSSKRPKSPVLGIPDPAAGVVLHQPLAAGPCPRFRGLPGEG